jgi:hypothetical protein
MLYDSIHRSRYNILTRRLTEAIFSDVFGTITHCLDQNKRIRF